MAKILKWPKKKEPTPISNALTFYADAAILYSQSPRVDAAVEAMELMNATTPDGAA